MSAPEKPPELPPGYHVENLSTLLHTVVDQYGDLLNDAELRLFQGFNSVSHSGKSLYCRLLTRRGAILREDKLSYADVPDLQQTLDELHQARLCSRNHPVDGAELLTLLTRPELIARFRPTQHSKLKKPELIQRILTEHDELAVAHIVQAQFPYVEAHHREAFETYKLCFFGNSHQDLTEFVVSDLGHVQYEQYSLCRDTRYFQNRVQIENQLIYSRAREHLEDKALLQEASQLLALAHSLPEPDQHPHLQRRYQKLVLTIARQLERLEQLDDALNLYQRCQRHPSRERQARILKKQGQPADAMSLCEQILEDSGHPEELEFAQRFLPPLTKSLNKPHSGSPKTPTKPIQPKWDEFKLTAINTGDPVELLAADALSDEQHLCCYVENTLFPGLFGLLFWDIIFAAVPGAFINPFQRGPLDLSSEDFYPRRRQPVDERLQRLETDQWRLIILQHFQQKQGLANPFVFWEALPIELLQLALERIPPRHLKIVFERILQHPGLYRSGFPDLIRFSADSYELIEVKGPGDKLQANQIRWLKAFKQAGIPASVCWVSWAGAVDD